MNPLRGEVGNPTERKGLIELAQCCRQIHMALPHLSGNPEQGTPCVGPRIVTCLGNALGVFGKNRLVTPPSRDSVKNYTQLQEKHLDNLGSLKTNILLQFLQKKLLGGDFF